MTLQPGDFTVAQDQVQALVALTLTRACREASATPAADAGAVPAPVGNGLSADLPDDFPADARLYLRHVEGGETIRALARELGCHASTVMRRIRRFEQRRDDPLVDAAIAPSGRTGHRRTGTIDLAQARRVLRRLAEPDSVLSVAPALEKAIISRRDVRTAILDRRLAEAMALRHWLVLLTEGARLKRYRISGLGREALRDMIGGDAGACGQMPAASMPMARDFAGARPVADARHGMAEAAAPFVNPHADAHRIWETRTIADPETGRRTRARVNIAESPLLVMGRRRDRDGRTFLTPEQVAAGERLREDFELSQMGQRITQNWEGLLTGCIDRSHRPGSGFGGGPEKARERVHAALRELGPGMADLVLRVCCFLEGIEMTEQQLGWSARSGKVVLRLALERLDRHYKDLYGEGSPLIG